MHPITLVCFGCGNKLELEVSQPPFLACDLMNIAGSVGWLSCQDRRYHRVVIFDKKECIALATTKKGAFRLRSPAAKNQS